MSLHSLAVIWSQNDGGINHVSASVLGILTQPDSAGAVRKEGAFHAIIPNIHKISFCDLSIVSQINLISIFF